MTTAGAGGIGPVRRDDAKALSSSPQYSAGGPQIRAPPGWLVCGSPTPEGVPRRYKSSANSSLTSLHLDQQPAAEQDEAPADSKGYQREDERVSVHHDHDSPPRYKSEDAETTGPA